MAALWAYQKIPILPGLSLLPHPTSSLSDFELSSTKDSCLHLAYLPMPQNSEVNIRKSLLSCLGKLRGCGPSLKDAVRLPLSLSKLCECVLTLSGSRTVAGLNDTMPAW